MRTVVEGVLSGSLPWGLVGVGAAFAICGILAGLPGLAFAVGIYLPLGSLTPIFLGGIVRRCVEAKRKQATAETDAGVLAASGMIAGEGLAGVLIATAVAARTRWPDAEWSVWLGRWHFAEDGFAHIGGAAGLTAAAVVVLLLCVMLYRAGRESEPRDEPEA
jgi:hypothetical protein